MLKQIITLIFALYFVSGCALMDSHTQPAAVDINTFNTGLTQQQGTFIAALDQQNEQNIMAFEQLSLQLKQLKKQINACKHTPKPKIVTVPTPCDNPVLGDKFILGATESVYVDELSTYFASRIDTGAESSSIDARNIVLFERDGAQWVRFDVHTQGYKKPPRTFESKVVRFVRIKQDAVEKDDRRPVIHAHLKIGRYAAETDLNLTDRSHLDYPLLLGRKFMKDIAVVDVGQHYIHGQAEGMVTSDN